MIAYNYCYSTCLGRIGLFKGQSKLGVTEVKQPPGVFEQLKDRVHGTNPSLGDAGLLKSHSRRERYCICQNLGS